MLEKSKSSATGHPLRPALLSLSFAFLLTSTFTLSGCGGGAPPPEDISANYTADGFKLYVEQLAGDKLRITIIENTRHENIFFSVYGLNDETQIPTFNTAVQVRSAHRVDSAPGKIFEVQMQPTDNWFALFRDDYDGTAWIFSTRTEMIRGQFRNGN